MNTTQLDPSTIVGILSFIVAVIIGLACLIVSYVIIQAQKALNRAEEAKDKFMEAQKAIETLGQKLKNRYEEELLRGYLGDLMNADSIIRLEAIKAIGERGTQLCILPLLNVLKNDEETDENKKMAEDAMIAIIGRVEKPLPEPILREMEISQGYINIILSSCRQMIEKIQNRRVLKKRRKIVAKRI